MQHLHCYAPGDGSMAFTWIENGQATGKKVTIEQVRCYRHSDEAKGTRLEHYMPVTINSIPLLVAPWQRVDGEFNKLKGIMRLDGRIYNYVVDPTLMMSDGTIPDNALSLQTEAEGIGTVEVRHISTRQSLRFYLRYEPFLFPYPCATCGDLVSGAGEYCCLSCQEKFKPKPNHVKTINAIDMTDKDRMEMTLNSFFDTKEGREEAEALFASLIRDQTEDDIDDEEMAGYIKDGKYEIGDGGIYLIRSN